MPRRHDDFDRLFDLIEKQPVKSAARVAQMLGRLDEIGLKVWVKPSIQPNVARAF